MEIPEPTGSLPKVGDSYSSFSILAESQDGPELNQHHSSEDVEVEDNHSSPSLSDGGHSESQIEWMIWEITQRQLLHI